jgi:hypothetical protein
MIRSVVVDFLKIPNSSWLFLFVMVRSKHFMALLTSSSMVNFMLWCMVLNLFRTIWMEVISTSHSPHTPSKSINRTYLT